MSAATGNARMHISEADAEQAYDRMSKADAGDLNRQITGMVILRFCGAALGIVFLAVNSYQATWALMKLSGAASGNGIYGGDNGLTADQWTIGATAFGLIFAAQVIAVRMVLAHGAWRFWGVVLLVGLMAFSTLTSAIHIGFSIQGGVVEATRQSDEYKLAKSRYEAALESKTRAERNWSLYQEDNRGGDPWSLNATHSQGPGRPYVEGINSAGSEVEAARRSFEQVKESGGGSAMGDVVGAVAGWFGTTTENFALGFGIFTVVLMEGVRIWLSLMTGIYLMQVMNQISEKRRNAAGQGDDTGDVVEDDDAVEPAPQPAQRARVMASSASGATDTIRGPVLDDPITVEGGGAGRAKPRAMFAPRKPTASAPEDRTPDNKRQAEYSKKLSRLKTALAKGTVPAGSALRHDVIAGMVGGNRKTTGALRNDLASAGVAHWRGNRLIAGAA